MIEDTTGWKYESLPVTCWHVPLWKYYSVGMIIPNIWKNKIHVPNHQPDEMHRKLCCYDVKRGSINQNMTKKYDLSTSDAKSMPTCGPDLPETYMSVELIMAFVGIQPFFIKLHIFIYI